MSIKNDLRKGGGLGEEGPKIGPDRGLADDGKRNEVQRNESAQFSLSVSDCLPVSTTMSVAEWTQDPLSRNFELHTPEKSNSTSVPPCGWLTKC